MPALGELREPVSAFNTLEEARQAVLRLPGVENYVPNLSALPTEIDRGLEQMTSEVINHIDADNMIDVTAYHMGWSDKKRDEFFAQEERKPYKSRMEFSSEFPQRLSQFLTIGRYLFLKHEEQKGKEGAGKARSNLRIFHNYSTQNLFRGFYQDFLDKVHGIDPAARHSGDASIPKETGEMTKLILGECKRVAFQSNPPYPQNAEVDLRNKVLSVIRGDFSLINAVLWNNSGEPQVKEVLEAIYEKRMNDRALTIEQLQILWAAEIYGRIIGLDSSAYYELNMPPGTVADAETNLQKYMQNPDMIKELEEHIKEEAPDFSALSPEQRDFFTLLRQRAKHLGLPERTLLDQELGERIKRNAIYIRQKFPPAALGSEAGERFQVFTPAWKGAMVQRPLNINYFNEKKQLVNIHILSPYEEETRFIGRAAHEETHKVHVYLLQTDYDNVTEGAKEAFPQLVESQMLGIVKSEKGQETPDYKNWGDLADALISRRQAPYGLAQMAVRKEMDTLWKENPGLHEWILPEREAGKIIDAVGPKVVGWYNEGYPMRDARAALMNNLNIRPMDGLAYTFDFLTGKKEDEEHLDMKTAFRKRFGELWLKDKDARAVLLYLMGLTRTSSDISTYGELVEPLSRKIDKVYGTLKKWGIPEERI